MSKEKKDIASFSLSSWKKKGKEKIKRKKGKFSDGLMVRVWVFAVEAWVQSLVGKLSSCKLHHMAQPKKKKQKTKTKANASCFWRSLVRYLRKKKGTKEIHSLINTMTDFSILLLKWSLFLSTRKNKHTYTHVCLEAILLIHVFVAVCIELFLSSDGNAHAPKFYLECIVQK